MELLTFSLLSLFSSCISFQLINVYSRIISCFFMNEIFFFFFLASTRSGFPTKMYARISGINKLFISWNFLQIIMNFKLYYYVFIFKNFSYALRHVCTVLYE